MSENTASQAEEIMTTTQRWSPGRADDVGAGPRHAA
jgi:hypothetical protein